MSSVEEVAVGKPPIVFEEYFELGQEETSSPFITPASRHWGANLTLKASLIAAVLLLCSFLLSFYDTTSAYLLLSGVYFLAGIPSLIESIEDLASFEINIDILMTLAAFSSVLIGSGFEGGLLLVLFALSGSMEDFVTTKAKGDISSLHKLSPTRACVIEPNGTLIERSVRDLTVGTHILVKSGQIVPLDGVVIAGMSSVNIAHLTGENMPMTRTIGDPVPAGARNMEGTLTLKVNRTSADSTLAQIIQLVTRAQEERPLLQRWFDRLSQGYAMAIIALSALFALTLPWVTHIPYFGVEGSIYRALAFLIAASPCALIIAIPIAYLSAVGVCARSGILLKGGITLDALARCTAIAFDKTGTLTTGQLHLEGIEGFGPKSENEINFALAVAYAMERNAVHPIAKAMVEYGQSKQLNLVKLQEFRSIPGYGLTAKVGVQEVYIGRPEYVLPLLNPEQAKWLKEASIEPQKRGELIAVLLLGTQLFLLRFLDTLRQDIQSTIRGLKEVQKVHLVMLTGDREESARRIATALGIDEVHAQLTPEQKLQYISEQSATRDIAMIGDGVNDAPALARATVGICMGKVGSTPAIDAADVVLLHDNIEMLGWLIDKARQTRVIVTQNLILASLAILFASIPALAGFVPLWLAVLLHEGGTVLVGLNGLRLLRKG